MWCTSGEKMVALIVTPPDRHKYLRYAINVPQLPVPDHLFIDFSIIDNPQAGSRANAQIIELSLNCEIPEAAEAEEQSECEIP